jgi:hypothetical protein
MFNPSNLTVRSILFIFCVSTGLAMSSLQGVSNLEIVQTGLLASVLFLGFLVGEAALAKYQQKAVSRRRPKRR